MGAANMVVVGKLHSQAEHVILYIKVLAFGCRGHKVRRLPLNSDFSSIALANGALVETGGRIVLVRVVHERYKMLSQEMNLQGSNSAETSPP